MPIPLRVDRVFVLAARADVLTRSPHAGSPLRRRTPLAHPLLLLRAIPDFGPLRLGSRVSALTATKPPLARHASGPLHRTPSRAAPRRCLSSNRLRLDCVSTPLAVNPAAAVQRRDGKQQPHLPTGTTPPAQTQLTGSGATAVCIEAILKHCPQHATRRFVARRQPARILCPQSRSNGRRQRLHIFVLFQSEHKLLRFFL